MFSYNVKGDFTINSELLQQPLSDLEKALFNMTEKVSPTITNKGKVNTYKVTEANIDMSISANVWPEDRQKDKPKFGGGYTLFLNFLEDYTGREVISCVSGAPLSRPDMEITCLINDSLSQIQVRYPIENIRNSLLYILSLIHNRKGRRVLNHPDVHLEDTDIISYWLPIKATIYLTQQPGEPYIETLDRIPIGFFTYDNGRSRINMRYEIIIPDHFFI
jgi:hypothetical protein